jgi:predicted phosphodiesterase
MEKTMKHVKKTFTFGKMKRLIFIGDVHGCGDELRLLMKKVGFSKKSDQIVSVGDLFRKGPKDGDVLKIARENDFWCVKGNHELKLLKQRKLYLKSELEETSPDFPLMSTFSEDDFEWIANLPYTIEFEQLGLIVVHAGSYLNFFFNFKRTLFD